MTQEAPQRARQSYRHEAFIWCDPEDFAAVLGSFVRDGIESGEPVMVAVTPEHTRWLREVLGPAGSQVDFVDMLELGRNPARIIPAWQHFVRDRREPGRPVRGIGEPIWPGRRAQELLECQLHEALLNVAVDPDTPLWLICPYDAGSLAPALLEEAHRSHPVIIEAGSHRGSAHYAGRAHVDALFPADLAEPLGRPQEAVFTARTVPRLTTYAQLELYVAGLPLDQATELAVAARQLVLGSLQRGAHQATVRIWSEPCAVVCEVADDVPVTDPLLGRNPATEEHEGLWRANQACDLVQLRSGPSGTAVRIFAWT